MKIGVGRQVKCFLRSFPFVSMLLVSTGFLKLHFDLPAGPLNAELKA